MTEESKPAAKKPAAKKPAISKEDLAQALKEIMVPSVSTPTASASVSRKVNLGNYENLDVWMSVTMPVKVEDPFDVEEVQEKAAEVIHANMSLLSRETDAYVAKIETIRDAKSKGSKK